MTDLETSCLTDLARVELAEMDKTQQTADECEARIREARNKCRDELTALPVTLQEERRVIAQEARKKAEDLANDLGEEARKKRLEIKGVAGTLTDDVFDIVLNAVLPGQKEGLQ